MSGREPPEGPEIEGYITPDDVREELNLIESLRSRVTGTDEYMTAMLENQRIMLMQMLSDMQTSPTGQRPIAQVDVDNQGRPEGYNVDVRPVPEEETDSDLTIPVSAVGVANTTIYENNSGEGTFQINGTVFSDTVRASEDIPAGEPIKVIAPGNVVAAVNDAATSLLGYSAAISGTRFEQTETQQNVSVSPDETETVLQVNSGNADWVYVGTNDETYSDYQYLIDGEELFDTPLKEPLGLYNDPFRFPTPLSVGSSITVQVTRLSGASGAQDYFSKVGYYE